MDSSWLAEHHKPRIRRRYSCPVGVDCWPGIKKDGNFDKHRVLPISDKDYCAQLVLQIEDLWQQREAYRRSTHYLKSVLADISSSHRENEGGGTAPSSVTRDNTTIENASVDCLLHCENEEDGNEMKSAFSTLVEACYQRSYSTVTSNHSSKGFDVFSSANEHSDDEEKSIGQYSKRYNNKIVCQYDCETGQIDNTDELKKRRGSYRDVISLGYETANEEGHSQIGSTESIQSISEEEEENNIKYDKNKLKTRKAFRKLQECLDYPNKLNNKNPQNKTVFCTLQADTGNLDNAIKNDENQNVELVIIPKPSPESQTFIRFISNPQTTHSFSKKFVLTGEPNDWCCITRVK